MRPLAVDLDGTLVEGETSRASLRLAFSRRPLAALGALGAALGGRAAAKRAFARLARPDPKALDYNPMVLAFLNKQRAAGRPLYLVTGADQAVAEAVAGHLGLFAGARGSDGLVNLKGARKLAWLAARFPHGFDYLGDSRADLPIWRATGRALLAGRARAFEEDLRAEGLEILASL